LFFRTFKPTAFIRTNVASGSYECQGRLLNRLVSRNLPFAIPPNAGGEDVQVKIGNRREARGESKRVEWMEI